MLSRVGARTSLLLTTIRNSIVFEAETSAAIADFCNRQRLAYNKAVEHMLIHPSTSRYDLFKELTRWKQLEEKSAPEDRKWTAPLSVLRPGLTRGRAATLAFLKADALVLRECIKEVDQRERLLESAKAGKYRKVKPPRHGNNPVRDADPKKLFRSRKNPFTLSFDDAQAIRVVSRRVIAVAGVTVRLARPLPKDAHVRALQVIERTSSVRRGRNRPGHDRSYDVRLVVWVDDPLARSDFLNSVGLDIGKAILVAASDGGMLRHAGGVAGGLAGAQGASPGEAEALQARFAAVAQASEIHPGLQPQDREHQDQRRTPHRSGDHGPA